MIFCLILTSCRINPKETKQSENNVLEQKQTEALGDYQWITSHCTYRTDIDEEDDFGILLATAHTDTIGAITVKRI